MTIKISFYLLIFTLFTFTACEPEIQRDYVGLQIPASLQHDAEAVAYLEKDAKQLNRFFNSLDDIATEIEGLAEVMSQIDTTDESSVKAATPDLIKRSVKLKKAMGKTMVNMMWYMGKDLLAGDSAPEEILKRLDTDQGVAFEKSLKHIKLQKELLKERAEEFAANLEKLDLPDKEE